eukprot:362247-Rhodomonas_salina.4
MDFGCIQYLPGARNQVGDALSSIPGRPTSDPHQSKGDIIVSNTLLSDIGLATILMSKLLVNPITQSATGTAQAPITRFHAGPVSGRPTSAPSLHGQPALSMLSPPPLTPSTPPHAASHPFPTSMTPPSSPSPH